jgi:predicted RNase H-like HicB family nuclease
VQRASPDRNGDIAYCPAFKGLHVDGASEQEAIQNAGEAALVYLNSLAANHEAIPVGPHCIQEQLHTVCGDINTEIRT